MVLQRLLVVASVLFSGAAIADGMVGDWKFLTERGDGEVVARVAHTSSLAATADGAIPRLVIRRAQSDDKVDLLVIDTHDPDKDNCEYKDWKLSIDKAEFAVLGYTFEPAKTQLKTKLGTSAEDFWSLFKKGYRISASALQKCDSKFGETQPLALDFSLRGSHAVYNFVIDASE